MRILVAEDDNVSAQLLARALRAMGHEVTLAPDGEQAWARHLESPFPVLITDWDMPVLNGLELCRRVRQRRAEAYTYILILTILDDRASLLEAFESGADDFASKPFDTAELTARLRVAERFVQVQLQLASRVADLSRANQKMKRDLEAAAAIQRSLLPSRAPDTRHATFAWQARSCEDLGGDTLNVVQLTPTHIAFYVVDVSGHGVAASLLSVSLNRILSPAAGEGILLEEQDGAAPAPLPPARVLAELNARFQIGDSSNYQYFTLIFGLLDLKAARLTWASAGHPGPVYQGGDAARVIENPSLPIGFAPDGEYEDRTLDLQPGDRVYFYSDGIPEANGSKGACFGEARLVENVVFGASAPLADSLASIVIDVELWSGGKPEDDLSLLAMEWHGEGGMD
jgi:sigma-B regulation protein RsbU (phosphoserine phosphatase)